MSYVAMDSLCLSAFGYSLEATGGRDEGRALCKLISFEFVFVFVLVLGLRVCLSVFFSTLVVT